MATLIKVSSAHALRAAEARQRLDDGIAGLSQSPLGRIVAVRQAVWTGNTLAFEASAVGATYRGTIEVADNRSVIQFPIPMLLLPLRKQIEKAIVGVARDLFA